jgi:CDP-paratose 2-epimerase
VLGRSIDVCFADWRPNDQRYFVADSRRVREALHLPTPLHWREGSALLLHEIADRHNVSLAGDAYRSTEAKVPA